MPGAVLFSGPRFSGKRTAALEVGRVRSCELGAEWNCPCPSCARHRALVHRDFLLLGPSSEGREWLAAARAWLERPDSAAARFLYSRTVRQVLSRFNPLLFEGEEPRLAKSIQLVRDAEELLDGLDAALPGDALGKALEKLNDTTGKLVAATSATIPVFQVRNAERWARLAPNGKAKTIVIENADRMLDSARNAMLKILEEPPSRCAFILLSSRKSALPATILSRLRDYRFDAGAHDREAEVLSRIFRAPEAASIAEYLDRFLEPTPERLEEIAGALIAAVVASERGKPTATDPFDAVFSGRQPIGISEAIAAALKESGDFGSRDAASSGSFRRLLVAMERRMGAILSHAIAAGDFATVRVLESWTALVREADACAGLFNQSPSLSLERMLSSMRVRL
jgi:DNA polymerase-3 subunit gamma/tau